MYTGPYQTGNCDRWYQIFGTFIVVIAAPG